MDITRSDDQIFERAFLAAAETLSKAMALPARLLNTMSGLVGEIPSDPIDSVEGRLCNGSELDFPDDGLGEALGGKRMMQEGPTKPAGDPQARRGRLAPPPFTREGASPPSTPKRRRTERSMESVL
jgi:hypothetical protein